jgi:serine/threonine protein kinase/tetratricopeptide (TPR) repeat protein
MIGKTISHYTILEKLGQGGMGIVYKAEDTRLDRFVAIKLLPTHLSSDREATKRFIQEAKAASALDHQHIGTIYEIDETTDGRTFIVMAYYEGETLRERIDRGSISVDEALNITSQVASGLARAHETEIVHRDIKPSNIIITKHGEAKIIDFGLAKLADKTKLTKEGITLGTLAYMSPEQAKGEEVDHRSDIFSLGAVLYELLTGEPPFKGEHEAAVLYEIVHEEPELLSKLRADVPGDSQNIVDKALQKNASDRYQSAADMIEDLTSLKAGVTPGISAISTKRSTLRRNLTITAISLLVLVIGYFIISRYIPPKPSDVEPKRIAVLPFENLGNAEDEYFADGMTDEVISRLATIRGLAVISRTSSMKYKKTEKGLREIGRELDVDYILEGTIRWDKTGDIERVRITPQLINVSDDFHLWAQNYERDMTQIFAVQTDIASKIAETLDITLLEPERRNLETKPTENLDAYQAYLRGMDYDKRPEHSDEDGRMAVQMFERAIELDPDFALAYAQLSIAHSSMHHYGHDRTEDRAAKAKGAADRALELTPGLPEAHLALAWYHYHCHREYDSALEELAIAERGLPKDSRILQVAGFIRRRQGLFDKALNNLTAALELSPQDADLIRNIAETYALLRRYPEAERYFDRSISQAPDQGAAYSEKAEVYWLWEGNIRKARATLEGMPQKYDPNYYFGRWFQQELFERNYQAALDLLASTPVESFQSQFGFMPKAQLAGGVYLLMGEPERASASYDSARILLEKEVKERPEDHRIRSSLGIVYAGLGRKEEAIREGKLGVELMPVSKDAYIGLYRVEDLAFIYLLVGESDLALERLEYLLSIPCKLSVPLLRLDPRWDSLRDHTRFQELLEKYSGEVN